MVGYDVTTMTFKMGDIPDEFDIVWPLVLQEKIGKDAWTWLEENTIERWIHWYPHPRDYGFVVDMRAKFYNEEDILIYKLKFPESSYAKSY